MRRYIVTATLLLAPVAAMAQLGPAPTTSGAGAGTDASNAAPTALTTLATFTVGTPGAYRVQNQSAATIQVQMCAAGGTGCSIVLLAPGAGANAQGADTSPELAWFTGTVIVSGATGSQFFARHN